MSEKDRRAIHAKLRAGMSVADLRLAIEGLFRSPFHLGQNDRNAEYLAFEHALREKNFDAFVALAEAPVEGLSADRTEFVDADGRRFAVRKSAREVPDLLDQIAALGEAAQ